MLRGEVRDAEMGGFRNFHSGVPARDPVNEVLLSGGGPVSLTAGGRAWTG